MFEFLSPAGGWCPSHRVSMALAPADLVPGGETAVAG
jgi:hypothetical protein